MHLLLDSYPDFEMYRYHLVWLVLTCIIFHSRSELVQSRFGGICIASKTTVVKFSGELVVKYNHGHPTHRRRKERSEKSATKTQ